MSNDKSLSVKIVAWTFLIPVVIYWGAMLKEFCPNSVYAQEIAIKYGQPYLLQYLSWAICPWGLIISTTCVSLCVGILRLKKIARISTIVVSLLYAIIWTMYVKGVGQNNWDPYSICFVLYAIFLAVFFTVPAIKEKFK